MSLFLTNLLSLNSPKTASDFSKSGENVLISCIKDEILNAKFYKCEIGSLSFVLALLVKFAAKDEFESFDEGYLSAESCFGEEEANEVLKTLSKCENIIIDSSLKNDINYENIKFFLNFLAKKFKLVIYDENAKKQDFSNANLSELKELENFDGMVVLKTKMKDDFLHASKQFLMLAKVKQNADIEISSKDYKIKTKIILDENLNSTIALLNSDEIGFSKVCIKEIK